MRKLIIKDRVITNKDVWVCAEIGCNHMGDADLCEKMIITAAACGVDAVKMQKRDNSVMFTKTALSRSYDNELSYGKTYGEHRARLDWFGLKEFERFKSAAEKHGVVFFATPFEQESAFFLHKLGVPMFKIASCDANNLPLIEYVAKFQLPMLISTGGCSREDLIAIRTTLDTINPNYAPLHCISTYPNADDQMNLRVLAEMRSLFPDNLIGFSSHHPGLLPIYTARFMGASVFEVHFTLNRGFRGTDHGFSLEPAGLKKICDDLRRIAVMMGTRTKKPLPEEKSGFVSKMGKGIYLNKPMKGGEVIKKEDLVIKSPAGRLKPQDIDRVVGRILINDMATGVSFDE